MTGRERNLWLIVGVVLLAAVVYSLFRPTEGGGSEVSRINTAQVSVSDYVSAQHLLRSKNIILGRRNDAAQYLSGLKSGFYSRVNPEAAQLDLLKEIERIAAETRLGVSQKSLIPAKNDTIGVALEGKTSAEAFFRFMESVAASDIQLKIQRVQLHSLPEERMINYQITVTTLLIDKKDGKSR